MFPIVCGAPNVAAGQKVVVATVGTIIYKGEESFEIKKAKIRGEVSEGMICAEDELGLGTSHAGIMVLSLQMQKLELPLLNILKLKMILFLRSDSHPTVPMLLHT